MSNYSFKTFFNENEKFYFGKNEFPDLVIREVNFDEEDFENFDTSPNNVISLIDKSFTKFGVPRELEYGIFYAEIYQYEGLININKIKGYDEAVDYAYEIGAPQLVVIYANKDIDSAIGVYNLYTGDYSKI